ncbi:MAG: bifunctional DNA-formamidopyrimidine glycosylase/DNA-(apurinic or apyrimidinic site) lyase [Thermoleophilia bacterium]
MPELPEVETIRRQLEPAITGRKIVKVDVQDSLVTAPESPDSFIKGLRGQTIAAVKRRGKYLLLELDSRDTLVIHLRMTGRLTQTRLPLAGDDMKHLRFIIGFSENECLAFHDTRRFGKAFILSRRGSDDYWKKLGPEPLGNSFNARYLKRVVCNRKGPIKSLLLNQSQIAGIGNIYADESLFLAGIHPLRPAGDLADEEIKKLSRAIKETLKRAIKLEGSSIDSYRDSLGERGRFQETFRVHRRQGEPCPSCKSSVEKIRVGGRGTYFCPKCQGNS